MTHKKTLPKPTSASALAGRALGPDGDLEAALAEAQDEWWRLMRDLDARHRARGREDRQKERAEINAAQAAKRPPKHHKIVVKKTLRPRKARTPPLAA